MRAKSPALLFALALVPTLILGQSDHPAAFPDCLNSSSSKAPFHSNEHTDCDGDPLDQANNKIIKEDEELLGIGPRDVRFIGCAAAPFLTVPGSGLISSQATIYYPTGSKFKPDSYAAPLLHELGHVFQLKQAGSYAKLRASLDDSNERIELGADFIAGIAANKLGLTPAEFLINLALIGSYNIQDKDFHGTPANRTQAFRNGYFYDNASRIADSYADFQDNLFAYIKH
jgi:hypothetical protein